MLDRTAVGDVIIFTLDRNVTSAAPRSFDEAPSALASEDSAVRLADRVFSVDTAVTRVYVASNIVQVTRSTSWNIETEQTIGAAIASLYRYYE